MSTCLLIILSAMADDVLFEFLHMEIVAHVYKEHATREDIDKVTWQGLYMTGLHRIPFKPCTLYLSHILTRYGL